MEKYILTGGPGTGKTTIVHELRKRGEITLSEVAREIIVEEQQKEQGILPWTDLARFQELVVERQTKLEEKIKIYRPARIFQDRSLVDGIAYAEEGKVKFPDNLHQLIGQAGYTKVFYLEQLPFYNQDQERKEDQELALRIHEQLYQVYDRLGFDIVTVPVCSIEERVQFVLKETQQEKNREIERKYRVEHHQVKEILQRYAVKYAGTDHEENTLYDFSNILKNLGCVFRIRENNSEHILTLKGPTKNRDMTNKIEFNFSIPKTISKTIDLLLPSSVSYSKRRENYHPLGDQRCTISFDYLPQLDTEFVEIEAATENQVLLWEKRLQLTPYAIKESYPALVKKNENANSR